MNIIIGRSMHDLDLGVFHVQQLYVLLSHFKSVYTMLKPCSVAGWILRTFTMRDPQVMLTLFKSLVPYRLDYASQLWSPYLLKHVYLSKKRFRYIKTLLTTEKGRDIALFMYGKLLRYWFQTSLIVWKYLCSISCWSIGHLKVQLI